MQQAATAPGLDHQAPNTLRAADDPESAGAAAPHIVQAACPHDCPDSCALRVTVQDGRILRVAGDAAHPPTAGVLCTKVSRYAERVYHPQRLLQPLKRVGRKGQGLFEPVSWAQALREIAERLQAIAAVDAQAIVPYSYAGTMGLLQGESQAARFFHRLGASRLDRTICASAGGDALAATYGAKQGMHLDHFADSRLILIWGSNPITSNLHFWAVAQEAKRRGAQLVCIDPRRSESADKCQQHLALRPGTDGALALALMQQLITHGWLDEDYIARHVAGFDALRDEALCWPPERAADECGLTVQQITALAHDYAHTRPAAIRLNYGMQRVRGGGNAVRLIALLPCLTGAWRQRGGGLLLSASGWARPHVNTDALQRPDLLAGRQPRTLNMSTLGADLQRQASADFGPRIAALIVYNSNPLAVAPDSAQVAAGLAREDLLTVVLEQFQTDTADYADYLLPATTQMEHRDVHTSYGHTWVLNNHPAIAALGEAKPNTQIFRELAQAMGFADACFADSDEQLAAQALSGVDTEALARDGWVRLPVPEQPFAEGGFPTPDGKAQVLLAPSPGAAPAPPRYLPPHESLRSAPALAARYPLALITPPARHFLNSSFVNVRSLRAIEGEPVLEIHPDDAAPRGIVDGAPVRIANDRGQISARAVVGTRARPGVVHALGIWWHKLSPGGAGVNHLTSQALTDIGAGATFYDCLVEVRPDDAPTADKRA